MSRPERDLMNRARDVIAARIHAEFPAWVAGHDLYGWHARRLDDGHEVRAAGSDGLRALISAVPPFSSFLIIGELRREHPAWYIWTDGHGCWHARRQGSLAREHPAWPPLRALHETSAAGLRERLAEQGPVDLDPAEPG
jgi:hypothetical protein